MYLDPQTIDKSILYQGDIIDNFPFYFLHSGQSIKQTRIGRFELGKYNSRSNKRLLAIPTLNQSVMILSQTCDLQRRDNVIVCPINNLQENIDNKVIKAGTAKDLREKRLYYWFYLPAYMTLLESFADLQTMVYIPRAEIEKYKSKVSIRLSERGRHRLSWALASYFGRPAE